MEIVSRVESNVANKSKVGLRNMTNTCYVNSVLQCLFLNKNFRNKIMSYNNKDMTNTTMYELKRLFVLLQKSDKEAIAPLDFLKNAVYNRFTPSTQQDVHEFLTHLLKDLDECDNITKTFFYGTFVTITTCVQCNASNGNTAPFKELQLPIPSLSNNLSLQSLIDNYRSIETIEGYRCERCECRTDVQQITKIKDEPPYLIIQLKIFGNGRKITNKIININETINVSDNNNIKYRLYAIIIHVGNTLTSGHYYSFGIDNLKIWYRFDDHKVNKTSWDEITTQISTDTTNTPYILFYRREERFSSVGIIEAEQDENSSNKTINACKDDIAEIMPAKRKHTKRSLSNEKKSNDSKQRKRSNIADKLKYGSKTTIINNSDDDFEEFEFVKTRVPPAKMFSSRVRKLNDCKGKEPYNVRDTSKCGSKATIKDNSEDEFEDVQPIMPPKRKKPNNMSSSNAIKATKIKERGRSIEDSKLTNRSKTTMSIDEPRPMSSSTTSDISFGKELFEQKRETSANIFTMKNVKYGVVDKEGKKKAIKDIVTMIKEKFERKRGFVYCSNKTDCDTLRQKLSESAIESAYYGEENEQDGVHRLSINVADINEIKVSFIIHNYVPTSIAAYLNDLKHVKQDELSHSIIFYSYTDVERFKRSSKSRLGRNLSATESKDIVRVVSYCENEEECRRGLLFPDERQYVSTRNDKATTCCDNCESSSKYRTKDLTLKARELCKLIKNINEKGNNVSMLEIVEIYKGSRLKKVLKGRYDKYKYFRRGKSIDRSSIRKILVRLVLRDILREEVTSVENSNHVYIHVRTGPKFDAFLKGHDKIIISSITRVTKVDGRKNNEHDDKSITSVIDFNMIVTKDDQILLQMRCYDALLDEMVRLSREERVPLSDIASISAIMRMSATLPNNEEKLLQIEGVERDNKFNKNFLKITTRFMEEMQQIISINDSLAEFGAYDYNAYEKKFHEQKKKRRPSKRSNIDIDSSDPSNRPKERNNKKPSTISTTRRNDKKNDGKSVDLSNRRIETISNKKPSKCYDEKVCSSCKKTGHLSSKSKKCENRTLSINERNQDDPNVETGTIVTIKRCLNKFIRDEHKNKIKKRIREDVRVASRIMIEVSFLLNAYHKYYYSKKPKDFTFDKRNVLRFTYLFKQRKEKFIIEDPLDFISKFMKKRDELGLRLYDCKFRTYIIQRLCTQYLINLTNNVKEHMFERIRKFIKLLKIEEDSKIIHKICYDFYYKEDRKTRNIITEILNIYNLRKSSVFHNPFAFLRFLFDLQTLQSTQGRKRPCKVVPIYKQNVKHFLYDTSGLYELLRAINEDVPAKQQFLKGNESKFYWKKYFNIPSNFAYSFSTNGIDVSIHVNGKKKPEKRKTIKNMDEYVEEFKRKRSKFEYGGPYERIIANDPGSVTPIVTCDQHFRCKKLTKGQLNYWNKKQLRSMKLKKWTTTIEENIAKDLHDSNRFGTLSLTNEKYMEMTYFNLKHFEEKQIVYERNNVIRLKFDKYRTTRKTDHKIIRIFFLSKKKTLLLYGQGATFMTKARFKGLKFVHMRLIKTIKDHYEDKLKVFLVNESYTTKTCSLCRLRDELKISKNKNRYVYCSRCRKGTHRDFNASKNILFDNWMDLPDR